MSFEAEPNRASIRRHLVAGAVLSGALVVGIGGWAATSQLAGAVIANGTVVVESNVKKVQHPSGGIVGELRVRDDDHVESGEVVVRLDETQTRANLTMFTKSLDELQSRAARLEAEKLSAVTVDFPEDLIARQKADPDIAQKLDGESKLFGLRLDARNGEKSQLQEQTAQVRETVKGLEEQIAAKSQEIDLIEEELQGVLDLWKKKLIPFARVTRLQRDEARLKGERGQLVAAKAEASGKISEVELKIIQVDQEARSKAAEELSNVRAKIAEITERKIAAEDQLKHIEIRAPQSGRVHQLAVHTVGGVIAAGETLMLIVPDDEALSVRARVAPSDIDELSPNQEALLRFSAFNLQTTPEIGGNVKWIAADQTEDERTGEQYYVVKIAIPERELARLEGQKLIPGMPVEAFFQTKSRTMLSYLVKPLRDQVMRAFRES